MAKKNSVEVVLEAKDHASQEVEKAIRKTTKEFSSLNSSLKKLGADSKEIEKINKEIKETNPEILEKELENVRKKLRRLGADSDQIQKITDELKEAKEESSDVGESAGGLKLPFDKATLAAGGIATVVGAAALELGKFHLAVEDMTLSLQAATGLSEEAMQGMEDSFNNLYKSARGTEEEVSRALTLVQQTFGREHGQKAIEGISEKALIMQEVFGVDVSESVRAVDVLMRNFGISSDEAFDLMTKGMQEGLNRSGDLTDTLEEYSPHFKNMGYSSEEFFAVLNNGMKNGARNTDFVADAVKEFNIRLKDGSTLTGEALQTLFGEDFPLLQEQLGKTGTIGKTTMDGIIRRLGNVENEVEQNQLGVALFGTKWEDLEDQAMLSLSSQEGKLKDFEGAAERAGETIDNSLTKKWTRFWNSLKVGREHIDVDYDDSSGSLGIGNIQQSIENAMAPPSTSSGYDTSMPEWLRVDKYHTGGEVTKLGPREVPAILKEGEIVVNPNRAKRETSLAAGGIPPIVLHLEFPGTNIFSGSKNEFKRFIQADVMPIVNREIGKTVLGRKKV
jgi:phage-related minor tail protein